MGDRAIHWALQQTHLPGPAQIILVRMCKDIDDRDDVWAFRRRLSRLTTDCNIPERSFRRYMALMERGTKPVLFRGVRPGRVNEYVILGPNRHATATYLKERYATSTPANMADINPGQCGRSTVSTPANMAGTPANVAAPYKELEGSLCKESLPVNSYRPEQGELSEIWEAAQPAIEAEVKRQNYDTWVRPMRPVAIVAEVLKVRVPNNFFVDWLRDRKQIFVRAVNSAGATIREVTFLAQASSAKPPPH